MKRMWIWFLDREIAKALKSYAQENGMKRRDTQRILKSILANPQLAEWKAMERHKERPQIVINIAVTPAVRKEIPEEEEDHSQSHCTITAGGKEEETCSIKIKVTVA